MKPHPSTDSPTGSETPAHPLPDGLRRCAGVGGGGMLLRRGVVLARGWQRSSPRAISSHQGRAHPRAASPAALSLRLVGCPSLLLDGGRAAVCWPERQKQGRALFPKPFFALPSSPRKGAAACLLYTRRASVWGAASRRTWRGQRCVCSRGCHAMDCVLGPGRKRKRKSCSSLAPPVRHHPRRSPLPPQKVKTIIIKLLSSAGTGYFYATKKNPTNIQHKLAFMKVRLPSSPSRNNCARLAGLASLPASALRCCVLQVRMRAAARYGTPELRPRRARDSPHPHPHPTPPLPSHLPPRSTTPSSASTSSSRRRRW